MFIALSYATDAPETPDGLMKVDPRKPVTETSQLLLKSRENEGQISMWELFSRLFEKKDEETLVDSGLLSYAYLEAGTIEAAGCLVCYFFAMWWHYGLTPSKAVEFGTEFTTPIKDGESEDIGLGGSLSVTHL